MREIPSFISENELYPHIIFSICGQIEEFRSNGTSKKVKGWVDLESHNRSDVPVFLAVTYGNEFIALAPLTQIRGDVAAARGHSKNQALGFDFAFHCTYPDDVLSFYAVLPKQKGFSLHPLQGGDFYRCTGICPVCETQSTFSSKEWWLRDHFFCSTCGSLPRARHFLSALATELPDWKSLAVYEIAPDSQAIALKCKKHTYSHYFPETSKSYVNGIRNENIERLTFSDDTFDIVVCSDILEHVFNPASAVREILRIVKPGGKVFISTPVFPHLAKTVCRAELDSIGIVRHLLPPTYHGNPVSPEGSLVTFDFGNDFEQLLMQWLNEKNFSLVNHHEVKLEQGIAGEFLDIFILTKI